MLRVQIVSATIFPKNERVEILLDVTINNKKGLYRFDTGCEGIITNEDITSLPKDINIAIRLIPKTISDGIIQFTNIKNILSMQNKKLITPNTLSFDVNFRFGQISMKYLQKN